MMKHFRQYLIVFLALALMLAAVFYWLSTPEQPLPDLSDHVIGSMVIFQENGQRPQAPDHTFTDVAGNDLRIEDFNGKILLVNFWATWCAPCVYELPALDRLQAELGGDDFAVLAISIDLQGMEKVEPYLEKLGINHLQPYTDPTNQLARAMNAISLPTTVLFDRDGRELGRFVGPVEWDDPDALAFMNYVTAASSPIR